MIKYLYEEKTASGGLIKYVGQDSTLYSADVKAFKTKPKQIAPANDFTQANYALMIFDRKINGVRIVPVHRHLSFEK